MSGSRFLSDRIRYSRATSKRFLIFFHGRSRAPGSVLLVFELTRSYEITIAAMLAIVFANLLASSWCGRSLYDQQLANRGIDLSLGRERAYLIHHTVSDHVPDCLPLIDVGATLGDAKAKMPAMQTTSAVVVDSEQHYLGILQQQQLTELDESGGLVQSYYTDWLAEQRERGRYLDVFEHLPPDSG